jgi:hypothetical protein
MDSYNTTFEQVFINFRMIVVVFPVKIMNNISCNVNGESRIYIYLSLRIFLSK